MSVLVLDVGTTSMRGILYDDAGEKLALHQVPNHVEFAANGEVNEPPSDWEDNTIAIISDIVRNHGIDPQTIEAVALTSQRSSIIPVDRDGKPLMGTIMWQDVRNRAICDKLSERNAFCFARTGSKVNTVFSGSKMTWVRRERPDVYGRVYKFVNIPEYINLIMTGEYASDTTYASRSGLMNLRKKEFDDELLALYEVDRDKLCRLYEPGSIVGHTTEEFYQRTGLPTDTPVIHSGGDQQCAAVGQGVTHAGNVSVVLGTGGFLIAACDDVPANLSDNVICNCASLAGKYVIEANILACSAAYDWFAHTIYGMENIDYGFIESELASVEGVSDCLVMPYLKGRGAPDWNAGAKGGFLDVTLATTRAGMYKGLMEGVFMELANHIGNFASYISLDEICVSGGLTKSVTLTQLLADIFGRRIINRDDKEATALGAFLVAATGLGKYPSVDEALAAVRADEAQRVYEPDMEKHALYEVKRTRMNAAYQSTKE